MTSNPHHRRRATRGALRAPRALPCVRGSRRAWAVALVAALLAQFTEPVCCALSPEVCCGGTPLTASQPAPMDRSAAPASSAACACCEAETARPPVQSGMVLVSRVAPQNELPLTTCGCTRDRGTTHAPSPLALPDLATAPAEETRTQPAGAHAAALAHGPLRARRDRLRGASHSVPLRI